MPDFVEYRKSISDELLSIKDRLRNIIDDRHWGEDGRYKEIILSDLLRKYLPQDVSVATGFVMGDENHLSTQIDIIVYQNNFPLLFKISDFVVVAKESVLGIIEVKTKLDSRNMSSAIVKSHNNGQLIGNHIFNGIFGYKSDFSFDENLAVSISDPLIHNPGYLNYICFGQDYFMKYWPIQNPKERDNKKSYSFYNIANLSFGYFVSNLIEDIFNRTHGCPITGVLLNSLYPIENTKEAYKLAHLEIKLPDEVL